MMLTYTGHCNICNKSISNSKNWAKHLKTKGHIKRENISKIIPNDSKIIPNDSKIILNDSKIIQKTYNTTQNDLHDYNPLQCEYCKKSFSRTSNKNRHINQGFCKVKTLIEKEKKRQEEKRQQPVIINNQQVINVQVVNVYGKEDYKNMLTYKEFEELMGLRGMKQVKKMLTIALGKQPNNTVAIPNMSQPYCLTMGENGPTKEYLPPIIQEIIDRLPKTLRRIFHNYFEEERHEYHPKVWLQDKTEAEIIVQDIIKKTKDKKYKKDIHNIIKTILYNNKLI
jgi:hypothetical protein